MLKKPVCLSSVHVVSCSVCSLPYLEAHTQEDLSDILKSAAEFERTLRTFQCFYFATVDNLLNNKTIIILLNLAEYHLILANSTYGLVG